MKKYNYVIFIVASMMIIICVATIILFNITRASTKKEEKNVANAIKNEERSATITNSEILETSNQEEKISPNAIIIFKKYYKKCNHTIEKRETATKEMANLNKEKFNKLYSDWKLQEFSSNQIILYKEIDDECGEHYVVKAENGNIVIYKITKEGDLELLENTQIQTKYLPQIDIDKLKQGVTLVGKDKLNSYIEDFE